MLSGGRLSVICRLQCFPDRGEVICYGGIISFMFVYWDLFDRDHVLSDGFYHVGE